MSDVRNLCMELLAVEEKWRTLAGTSKRSFRIWARPTRIYRRRTGANSLNGYSWRRSWRWLFWS